MKKKVDIAERIAKQIAITAGICSSDDEDGFDSRNFIDGFTGKLKKKVDEFLDGIHAGDTIINNVRVPCVFFPEKHKGEYTEGKYVGEFEIAYSNACENDGVQFSISVSLAECEGEVRSGLMDDKSCYTVHVRSFSGERAVLKRTSNAFMVTNIGESSILSILNGDAVIDEYGVDAVGADADKKEIAEDNHKFIFDEMEKTADGIKKKISVWLDENKVISKLWFDFGNMVNKNENVKKGIDVASE